MIGRLFAYLKRLFLGETAQTSRRRKRKRRARLRPLRREQSSHQPTAHGAGAQFYDDLDEPPYRFARFGAGRGKWWDLSQDGNDALLRKRGLPVFHTPEELADWLDMPIGRLAWLSHHCLSGRRPESAARSHYHYRWIRKRSGGMRLIEAPKLLLRGVQTKLLREILDRVPPHRAAHGFVRNRSIVTNAEPHVGRRVVIRFDLENFYANVRFPRVVAIFRALGYSREAAVWLGRLTTAALPINLPFPDGNPNAVDPYVRRHLPQGAPTSPALANLSAYSLDVRLSGMTRRFDAAYTRYGDDLTFSGSGRLIRSLPVLLPLVTQIIRKEKFKINVRKRKVIRDNRQQRVAGVVVNRRVNVSRREFDRLKATLHNCVKSGPRSQNRDQHEDFAAHLRGRIAHVRQLNPQRAAKLERMFNAIRW